MKTSKEVCKELRIKYYKLDYLIRNGYVPEPKKLASGLRIFTENNIKEIKRIILEGGR